MLHPVHSWQRRLSKEQEVRTLHRCSRKPGFRPINSFLSTAHKGINATKSANVWIPYSPILVLFVLLLILSQNQFSKVDRSMMILLPVHKTAPTLHP